MRLGIFLFITFFLFPHRIFSQESDWKLEKNQAGIQVYTRLVEDLPYKAFRAIVEINCDTRRLIQELKDIQSFPKWYHMLTSGDRFEQLSEDEGYCYITLDMPWPVSDRDNVFHYQWEYFPAENRVFMTSESRSDYRPAKAAYIRIPYSLSTWEIISLGPEKVRLIHEAQADPGGSIPSWLANSFVTDGPYKSLFNLRKRIEEE
ncbi:MAG: START domain-containing protein [Bacteroidota bacterium]